MDRTILHVDCNNFYASVECMHNPALRGLPLAVGGDPEARHGIILAKSYEAKAMGVQTGEALWQARQKCPNLTIIQPHFDRYLAASQFARKLYGEYTDQVEPYGLDEAWLDITGSLEILGTGEMIAQDIRKRIKREYGITVSIGLSFNKVFAKLGSDYKKPDAITTITQDNYKQIVWPLPAGDLLFVGRSTQSKLAKYGVKTIGDIANMESLMLDQWFGKCGLLLGTFANGEDRSPVQRIGDEGLIKSIGNSTTTPRDPINERDVRTVYYALSESVAARLREHGLLCRGIQVSLRDNELIGFERQLQLDQPTCLSGEICDAAMALLHQHYKWHRPLRSIGVRGINLIPANAPLQLSAFSDDAQREKTERLERTIDDIRRRFGHFSIVRTVTKADGLGDINPQDHISIGGTGTMR